MSPGDRHLCIVPGRRDTRRPAAFLPFEGDRTLALILSKALLPAADTQTTDPTIRQQITR